MSASNSTASARPNKRRDTRQTPAVGSGAKPAKPYADYPLFPHATGRWAKKIRGQLHYFGKWSDPDAALAKYLTQKEALHRGIRPRPAPDGLTVKDLANAFLAYKKTLEIAGELSPRSWADYFAAGEALVKFFGSRRFVADLGPDDFAELRTSMAKRWGPVRLGNTIQRVRTIFKYGFEARLLPLPMVFGPGFARPTKKVLRLARAKQGDKLFTAEEIRKLLAAANVPMRAMILLGVNCGFGNTDCANLPQAAVDLDAGWINYPRPKTGIRRRCPLWPETVDALRAALAKRPSPRDQADAGLVFITKHGRPWGKDTSSNPVSQEMSKLLKDVGIAGRKGTGFYTLRHTFRTVADATKDQPACDFIMGHEKPDMASVYRETISDERLQAVASAVRTWLFGGL
jgi:integrase